MREELNNIIENNDNISQKDMDFLEKINFKYPYFHLSNILFLKGLKNLEKIKYNNYLERISLMVPNRKALFEFLNSDYFENDICKIKKNVEDKDKSEEIVNQEIENIVNNREEIYNNELLKEYPASKNIIEIELNLNDRDVSFLKELKDEILSVKYKINKFKIPQNTAKEISMIRGLLNEHKPLFFIHSAYVEGYQSKKDKKNKSSVEFIYSEKNHLIQDDKDNNAVAIFKKELDAIENTIENFLELDENEYRKEDLISIVEKEDFFDKQKLLDIIEAEHIANTENIEYTLLKLIDYRKYILTKEEEYSNEFITKDDYKSSVEDSIQNINIIQDYILKLIDNNHYLPVKYIENELYNIKESISYLENDHEEYEKKILSISKRKMEILLQKIDEIEIDEEQKKLNVVFDLSKEMDNNVKLIEYYDWEIALFLDRIDVKNKEILDFVFLEELENEEISFFDYKDNSYIKYINSRPIKKIDISSISKDNNVYINITVLLDYYKKEILKILRGYEILSYKDYVKVDIIEEVYYRLNRIFENNKMDIPSLFIDLFNLTKDIDYLEKKAIENTRDIKYLMAREYRLLENISKDMKYLKIANIYYLIGRENTNNIFRKGKNILQISFSRDEIKLIEKGENVILQKFSKNIDRIEESFKKRFRILGIDNNYLFENYEKKLNISDNKEVKNQLIEKFITSNITSISKNKLRNNSAISLDNDFKQENITSKLATETLIEMYIKQGKYDMAIRAYKILLSQNPQKQSYYNKKIRDIQNIIDNENKDN